MADHLKTTTFSSITALSSTTASRITSGQVLIDPSSVVKELIDNALDARAKSIFVDIAINTIDCIQVKDDGHGIPADDRHLVCRRHCTSKIKDLHDLKALGGKWLGFRGEALSSMAEMSGTISITTKVEGEPVAVRLEYGRDGELAATKRDSHPVGTTVKVTSFFEYIPVRKQTAIKSSSKGLAKIRRLMQAYALARPTIQFRLHVLNEKNSSNDFIYAPKVGANVQDAVFKVIGKDCARECDWTTLEIDGFEIQACLPKPSATWSNIVNQGAFISVDARPVSANRGTIKQVIAAFKNRLQKFSHSHGNLKNPFFYMNIVCPLNSYDVNIEPAKDDVMFDDGELVVSIIDKLLMSYYAETILARNHFTPPKPIQTNQNLPLEKPPIQRQNSSADSVDLNGGVGQDVSSNGPCVLPQWRSSMYGIDVDDLEYLQEAPLIVEEQEDGRQAVSLSNPWTIMRMNTSFRPKISYNDGQLPSPAQSPSKASGLLSSSTLASASLQPSTHEPLTPQTSPRRCLPRSSLDCELEKSVQHLPQTSPLERTVQDAWKETSKQGGADKFITPTYGAEDHNHTPIRSNWGESSQLANSGQHHPSSTRGLEYPVASLERSLSLSPGLCHDRRRQKDYVKEPIAPMSHIMSDLLFKQIIPSSQPLQSSRQRKKPKNNFQSSPSRPTIERTVDARTYSKINKDIRGFLTRDKIQITGTPIEPKIGPTLMALNSQAPQSLVRSLENDRTRWSSCANQQDLPLEDRSHANSAELYPYSHNVQDESHVNKGKTNGNQDVVAQLKAYLEREHIMRPLPDESPTSKLYDRINKANSRHDPSQSENVLRDVQDMREQFRLYEQKEGILGSQSATLVCQNQPCFVTSYEENSKPSLPRRRAKAESQRTKSSRLPLERMSRDYRVHDYLGSMATSVASIIQRSQKLEMEVNSPKWGNPVQNAYSVFLEFFTERKIMSWVIKLDMTLHELHERSSGVDTRGQLLQGIQQTLDATRTHGNVIKPAKEISPSIESSEKSSAKKADHDKVQKMRNISITGKASNMDCETHDDIAASNVPQLVIQDNSKQKDDEMPNHQLAQFSDLDTDEMAPIVDAKHGNESEEKDGYPNDIEDEMLMDL